MYPLRAVIACAAMITACLVVPGFARASAGAVPDQRVETPLPDSRLDADVEQSFVRLHHPLPASVAKHPEACDWIGYLRFRSRSGPADSAKADAILTTQPGTLMGAAAYAIQGNQVVHKAAARGKHVEYWAFDRRSNCAEDHFGQEAAGKAHDPGLARDYYLRGKQVGGRSFAGFTSQLAMPYLADFGMEMTLDDWRAAIVQALPSVADRRKVFCGGHSYGGFLVGGMLSWDFDGDIATQDDAGYNICGGGGFTLEGLAMNDPVALRALPMLEVLVQALGGGVGQTSVNVGLASGVIPRTLDASPLANIPKLMATVGLAGLTADLAPDKETDLLKVAAAQPDLMLAFRTLLATDPMTFVSGIPGPGTYRLTGDAALGMLMDNNSQWLQVFQVGAGTFDGGRVEEKVWPVPNMIGKIPVLGQLISQGLGSGRLMAPAEPGKLYGWRNYDKVGDLDAPKQLDLLGQPLTGPDKEVTDIRDLAHGMSGAGPADYWELYFPTRQLTDMYFAYGLGRVGGLSKLLYREEGLKKRPILTMLAGDGPVQNVALGNVVLDLAPKDRKLIPGYRHMDMATAAARQNNGQPEPVSSDLVAFALQHAR